jgi:DNA gyrase/topoisomerase IV subunit A
MSNAGDIIRDNLRVYGKDTLLSQFPSHIDGLKIVHRRIIYTLRDCNETNSFKALGAIKEFHNHGDASIYDALVRMSTPWTTHPSLIKFHGDNGMYSGSDAAAARYTSIELSQFARDIFFNIDASAIPMKLTTDRMDREPIYLIPAIPTALLYGTHAIGYGESHRSFPRNINDVCDLVVAYCTHIQNTPHLQFNITNYAHKLVPDFPIDNDIINYAELISEYKKGNFDYKVRMEGKVELTADTIYVKTVAYGTPFLNSKKWLLDAIRQKGSWFDINIPTTPKDLANTDIEARLEIKLKRGTNPFEAWEVIKKLIQFSGTIAPILSYTDPEGYVHEAFPLKILMAWYTKRAEAITASKSHDLAKLQNQLHTINALITIIGHTDEVLAIIKENSTDGAIRRLSERFSLTTYQSTELTKARLSILTTTSSEELQRQHDKITRDLDELKASFSQIPKEIAEKAIAIKKLYGKRETRTSTIPKYIGCVLTVGGYIQFEDTNEIEGILQNFSKNDIVVRFYDGPTLIHTTKGSTYTTKNISRVGVGEVIGLPKQPSELYTINISAEGTICCVKGITPGLQEDGYFYTTRMSKVVTRHNGLKTIDVTKELSQRKSICRGAQSDIIYIYPDTKKAHYLLIMNDTLQNKLIIQRIPEGVDTNIPIIPPVGKSTVLHHMTGLDWYFQIPSDCISRNTSRLFHIPNVLDILQDDTHTIVDLNQTKWKRSTILRAI